VSRPRLNDVEASELVERLRNAQAQLNQARVAFQAGVVTEQKAQLRKGRPIDGSDTASAGLITMLQLLVMEVAVLLEWLDG
jgi:hypothetical protein